MQKVIPPKVGRGGEEKKYIAIQYKLCFMLYIYAFHPKMPKE